MNLQGETYNIGFYNVSLTKAISPSNMFSLAYMSNKLFFTDLDNREIKVFTIGSNNIYTFAGNSSVTDPVDGTGYKASFLRPYGIVADVDYDLLYVADLWNIRQIDSLAKVTTVTSNVNNTYEYLSVAVTMSHDLYAVGNMSTHGFLNYINMSDTNMETNVVNINIPEFVAFGFPTIPNTLWGIAVSGLSLYVCGIDSVVYNILLSDATTAHSITLLAGSFLNAGYYDSVASDARFNAFMSQMALDGIGNLYLSDTFNDVVRRIELGSVKVTTVAGSYNDTNTDFGRNSSFSTPRGIVATPDLVLYVIAAGSEVIDRIDYVFNPTQQPVQPPTTQPSPSKNPSVSPSFFPINLPSVQPSFQPSIQPTTASKSSSKNNAGVAVGVVFAVLIVLAVIGVYVYHRYNQNGQQLFSKRGGEHEMVMKMDDDKNPILEQEWQENDDDFHSRR